MITVKRYDNKKTGEYSCHYYYNGREIADYYSSQDTIYCNSRYIVHDWGKPVYDRALNGEYKEAYAELFAMLNADETSKMSEFLNV